MENATIQLLGVSIDAVTASRAVDRMHTMLAQPKLHHVVTPNSEMLVEASKSPKFRSVLNGAALRLPDSIGLLKMAKRTGQHLPERVTGVDTVARFLSDLPAEHGVFLLGAADGIAEAAADTLRRKNPALAIVGVFSGSPKPEEATEILRKINAAQPRVLLVAFGAPAQDLWIDRYKQDLHSVRIAMGVGGTFDFLAGKAKRAPKIFQSLGLEWLWRVMRQPSRIARIWNAVIVFPWLVVRDSRKRRKEY